jgi:hypothetical protein
MATTSAADTLGAMPTMIMLNTAMRRLPEIEQPPRSRRAVKTAGPIFPRKAAMELARFVMDAPSAAAIAAKCRWMIEDLLARYPRRSVDVVSSWEWVLDRIATAIETGTDAFTLISMDGNSKLPFASWSCLPVVTCPGMGECARFCYSLRAWRNPAAYGRQLWATIALRFFRRRIIEAWKALPEGIVVRLYVDGDFDSTDTLRFWFNLIAQRPDLRVYGYSKSWHLLVDWHRAGHTFPANYFVNVSSGSRFDSDPAMRQAMLDLPVARGEFIVVKVKGEGTLWPRGFARYGSKAYHEAVYAAAKAQGIKGVSCSGDCGGCGNGTHWCGAIQPNGQVKQSLIGLPILIGAH